MQTKPALELKGRSLSFTRLRLLTADHAALRSHLDQLRQQAPEGLHGMAVVVEGPAGTDLAAAIAELRSCGMRPLAVVEGPLAEAAQALGFPILAEDAFHPVRATKAAAAAATPAPAAAAPAARKPARVVDQPVRSGQQIYAEGSDLIVLATVSAGAEVVADGCVHVYGTLRGRAGAGVSGDVQARIFCRKFEGELVSVAGVYALADQLQGLRGFAAQAFLKDGQLKIELMK